jgi:hypothetical protein
MSIRQTARGTLVLIASVLALPAGAADPSLVELKSEAASLTAQYAVQLKTALDAAMETTGPMGALDVCHSTAPTIASDLSRRSGWTVARTSLKPRNTSSAPDNYERRIMQSFETRIATGEKAAELVSAEIVEQNGAKVFRFVKAIPTAQQCLTCHGSDIKPEVKQKISELYPNDTATSFSVNDMRGVFTLQKRLDGNGK